MEKLSPQNRENNAPITDREERYGQRILLHAKELIHDFLPDEDMQPTTLVMRRNFRNIYGVYMGKVNNAGHHIALSLNHSVGDQNAEKDLGTWIEEKHDEYTLVHELFHQMHAEAVGQEAMMGRSEIELEELDDMSSEEILKELYCDEVSNRELLLDLSSYVKEGVAVLGSLFIMKKDEERLRIQGKLIEAEAVHIVRMREINDVRAELRALIHPDEYDNIGYTEYAMGLMLLMRGLERRFGMEALPDVIKLIDLGECSNILQNSERFWEILDNPILLPGLEDFAQDRA